MLYVSRLAKTQTRKDNKTKKSAMSLNSTQQNCFSQILYCLLCFACRTQQHLFSHMFACVCFTNQAQFLKCVLCRTVSSTLFLTKLLLCICSTSDISKTVSKQCSLLQQQTLYKRRASCAGERHVFNTTHVTKLAFPFQRQPIHMCWYPQSLRPKP